MAAEQTPRTTDDLLAALPEPWPREDVLVANGTLSVRHAAPLDAGSAEPALFVHGLGGNATNWTDLMALLQGKDVMVGVIDVASAQVETAEEVAEIVREVGDEISRQAAT